MELYLDNNTVSDLTEILKLRDLPKLIILDCSYNPLASHEDYRIFCIFNLRKLRVLDGVAIDQSEHLEARETYSGRLTDELLKSKLNGRSLAAI
jgi:Leucine-rich repeat (LRR) protein